MRPLPLLLLVLALATAPAAAQEPDPLEPVPSLALDAFEPAVREQLEEARAELDGLLAAHAAEPSETGPGSSGDLARAFGRLGRLYLFYDRPEAARTCFENALRLVPDASEGRVIEDRAFEDRAFEDRYYLAKIHQDAGRSDEARDALERILEARPDDLPSRLRLAEVSLRQRRLAEAVEHFQRALEQAGTNGQAGANADNRAMAEAGLGRVASTERRWSDAIGHYRRALELQPRTNTLYHPLGLALRREGRIEEAKAALDKAGNNAPFFDDPLVRRLYEQTRSARSFVFEGNRARRRGLVELAVANYRRALELDPTEANAHYNLGVMLGQQGQVALAEFHFRQATIHDPDHRDAWFNLAVGLRASGRLPEAIDAFGRAVELDPADHGARLEHAITLFAAGRRQAGAEGLSAVWKERPESVDDLLLLALYLEQTGLGRDPEGLVDIDAVLDRAAELALTPEERRQVATAKASRRR